MKLWPTGPCLSCPTQFLLSDLGLPWGCCFQRPSYHSAPGTHWKREWTKTPWGNDGSWRISNPHIPYHSGRHRGLILLGSSKRLRAMELELPIQVPGSVKRLWISSASPLSLLNLPSPLLLFLGITSQGTWTCLGLCFWGEPKVRQSPRLKPASLCHIFLHWEMLANYLQVSKSNP